MGFRTQELDGLGSGATERDLGELPQGFSIFSDCDECGVIEKRFPITRPAERLETDQIRYFVDQEFNEAEKRR